MGFKAKDIMTTQFVSVRKDDSLDHVLTELLRRHVSGLPVLDGDGHLVGVITEHDVLGLLYEPGGESKSVCGYFTEGAITVDELDSLTEVADLFLSNPVRRLPVLRDGKLVGIISRRDLVRYIHQVRMRFTHELEGHHPVAAGAE